VDGRLDNLYAAARIARSQAQQSVRRSERVLRECQSARREHQQTCAQVERLRELWLSGQRDRLRYSPYARLQARLASMPVIEQAKGILMAQCGCSAEQAFDALRHVSQRENIRVRDLAARIVSGTAPPSETGDSGPARQAERMTALLTRQRRASAGC